MRDTLLGYKKMNMVPSAAVTVDGGTAVKLPVDLHSGCFVVDVATVTGTSPTLDLNIQTSPDGGTTWYTAFRFAQITAASIRRLAVKFAAVDAGSEAAIATTGGALATGCPLTDDVRVYADVGGTNPSFTYAVHFWGRRLGSGVTYS